jgi:hypothetical protein
VSQAQHHVTTSGTADGDGSLDNPWDLQTALNHPEAVKPGDTIYVHAGKYIGYFDSNLNGTLDNNITVRPYQNDQVVLEGTGASSPGNVLDVDGSYTTIRDLIITNEYQNRVGEEADIISVGGIYVNSGQGHKIINCIIYDVSGIGAGLWKNANNLEFYGNIVFNVGTMASDRGHGHALYTQNNGANGPKLIKNNILFSTFAMGLNLYGSSNTMLTNFNIMQNIIFNAGILRGDQRLQKNICCYGGDTVLDDITFDRNITYFRPDMETGQNVMIGQFHVNEKVVITNNYIFGGWGGFEVRLWNDATVTNNLVASNGTDYLTEMELPDGVLASSYNWDHNRYYWRHHYRPFRTLQDYTRYNIQEWQSTFGIDANSSYSATYPENTILVMPNAYEAGRAHIVVLNFDELVSVSVDLSEVLKVGDSYFIYDVENVFGEPVATGTYEGSKVTVPMNLSSVSQPIGNVPDNNILHTPVEFNTFLLRKATWP